MRVYSSFLVRYWLTDEALQDGQSVLQAEHIQTGTSMRAACFVELERWVLEICRSALAKNQNPRASGHIENREQVNRSDIRSKGES
jgi:hypothetical protein